MPPSLPGLAVALPQALEVDRAALVRCSGSQRRGAEGCYQCPAFLLRQESCAAGFCPGAEPTAISAGDMHRHLRVVMLGARAQLTAWKFFGWCKFSSGSGSSRLTGLQKPLGCARYLKFSVTE